MEWSRIDSKGQLLLNFLALKISEPRASQPMFPSHFQVFEQKLWVYHENLSSSGGVFGRPEAEVTAWTRGQLGKWESRGKFSLKYFHRLHCRSRAPAVADMLLGNVACPGKKKVKAGSLSGVQPLPPCRLFANSLHAYHHVIEIMCIDRDLKTTAQFSSKFN